MKLSHLRYLTEIAKTGSITRAAQNLYMGQPNLSKAVREMERDFGMPIFKRTAKGVEPTQKGRLLIEKSAELLEQADSIEREFFGVTEKKERFSAALCGVEYCIPVFEKTAIGYEITSSFSVDFFRCDRKTALELVETGEVSFAVIRDYSGNEYVSFVIEKKGLKARPLAEGKKQIITEWHSNICQKEKVGENDLKDFTEVYIFGSKDCEAGKSISVSDFFSGCRVISGLKNGFMFISSLDHEIIGEEICIKDLSCDDKVIDWLVYAEGKRFIGAEAEFLNKLKETIRL